jgi:hypothetical protein
MKQVILALCLMTTTATASAAFAQPAKPHPLDLLTKFYTLVCEVGLRYDQTPMGPSGWYCADAKKTPVKDRIEKK